MKLSIMSGAGNTFAVVDGGRESLGDDRASLARCLCVPGAFEWPLDGLLVVERSSLADCRMTIFNADGSHPEACGNGLRCVAKFAREHGYAVRDRLRVETDAGVREVELVREAGGAITAARASMGKPRSIERDIELSTSHGRMRATLVDMGNPHCVLFVEDERTAPVASLGAELERHPRFPQRTNVEFCARRAGKLWLRVWERGVGETAACGTGACASAVVATLLTPPERLPIEVELPGGRLTVAWNGTDEVVLGGPCAELWAGEWSETGAPRA